MNHLLALRMRTPDEYIVPMPRLAEMGVEGVEINWPEGASPDDVRAMVEPHGLRVTSITALSTLAAEDYLAPFETLAPLAAAVGAKVLFTSLKAEDLPIETAHGRLRAIGEVAAAHGVKAAIETHPDLCENGAKAAATVAAVNHPALGINFDTANIYYYNEDADTINELRKELDCVVSVHLKDTMGGFKSGEFPVFGRGVVNFAGVFDLLDGRGFDGPYTMELEGTLMRSETEDEMAGKIAGCIEHLRSVGAL